MTHRIFSGLAVLVALALPAGQALALAGGPTLVVQTSPSAVAVNGQFTATVLIDTKTYSVSGAELHITFPSDKLQAISIGPGTFLPVVLSNGSTGTGTASIAVGSGSAAKQGTGSVAVITFRALSPGIAAIGFADSTQVAASSNGQAIASNAVDTMTAGSVTISGTGGGATVAPTTPPVVVVTPVPGTGGSTAITPLPPLTSAGGVSTGPGQVTALALVIGGVSALLYTGYTRTGMYHRREARSIADKAQSEPLDFRS